MNTIEKANKVFLENFPAEVYFERAIFFSWYCEIGDCKYCYMSTQPKNNKIARRTTESILAEVILCKKLNWDFGFLSGGHNAFKTTEFQTLLKLIHQVYGKKFYINIGPLKNSELSKFKPYIKGVVAAIESVNPKIHKHVCPSKPHKPMEDMLKQATDLKLKKAITIILGLGETIDDFKLLKEFIEKHKINKIHFYSLNPQKGTIFEKTPPPRLEYYSEWIALTRINFPKINIEAGIWTDRTNWVSTLLKAGANSISKFPIIKQFNSKYTKDIQTQCKKANRTLKSNISDIKDIDWNTEINSLKVNKELKEKIGIKLNLYLKSLKKRK